MFCLTDNRFNRYSYIGTNTDTNIGIGAPLILLMAGGLDDDIGTSNTAENLALCNQHGKVNILTLQYLLPQLYRYWWRCGAL